MFNHHEIPWNALDRPVPIYSERSVRSWPAPLRESLLALKILREAELVGEGRSGNRVAEEVAGPALDESSVLEGVLEKLADVVEKGPGQESVAVHPDLSAIFLAEDVADADRRPGHVPGVLDEAHRNRLEKEGEGHPGQVGLRPSALLDRLKPDLEGELAEAGIGDLPDIGQKLEDFFAGNAQGIFLSGGPS